MPRYTPITEVGDRLKITVEEQAAMDALPEGEKHIEEVLATIRICQNRLGAVAEKILDSVGDTDNTLSESLVDNVVGPRLMDVSHGLTKAMTFLASLFPPTREQVDRTLAGQNVPNAIRDALHSMVDSLRDAAGRRVKGEEKAASAFERFVADGPDTVIN